MKPKYGQKWGLQQASKEDKVDLCDMISTYRIILFKDMKFMMVSGLTPARNINITQWEGKGIILTREQAINEYPGYFYKSSNAYKENDYNKRFVVVNFSLKAEIASYIRTKKNQSAYLTKLVEMERSGIIKVD